MISINHLETGGFVEKNSDLFMTNLLLAVTRKHFYFFYSNSEASASELLENLKKCILGTAWKMMLSADSDLQSFAKGLHSKWTILTILRRYTAN